ncbi:unnamed protein product [Clavelina lepadiformis]|uniref:Uncharacterized protein n=1 Tax=Clavelina lepadiformis TaxID=159417 RepID=A0ABP0GR95_CLALP
MFHPNNLTPKEVSEMKLQGENVLNYVHQYHKLLESGAISSPLTAIEADAVATAQTMTNALVKEYKQRMTQVAQSYLSEKQLQENHKTLKSQLGQKFDSEMEKVLKTYPNIFEKYRNQLDVDIEKDLVLYQSVRLTINRCMESVRLTINRWRRLLSFKLFCADALVLKIRNKSSKTFKLYVQCVVYICTCMYKICLRYM